MSNSVVEWCMYLIETWEAGDWNCDLLGNGTGTYVEKDIGQSDKWKQTLNAHSCKSIVCVNSVYFLINYISYKKDANATIKLMIFFKELIFNMLVFPEETRKSEFLIISPEKYL